jgi:hypothetical protein
MPVHQTYFDGGEKLDGRMLSGGVKLGSVGKKDLLGRLERDKMLEFFSKSKCTPQRSMMAKIKKEAATAWCLAGSPAQTI